MSGERGESLVIMRLNLLKSLRPLAFSEIIFMIGL